MNLQNGFIVKRKQGIWMKYLVELFNLQILLFVLKKKRYERKREKTKDVLDRLIY